MRELGVLCNCKFCRANSNAKFENGDPVEADDYNTISLYDKERNKYIIVDGEKYPIDRVVHTGGRRALWIYLEDGEEAILLSSKGKSFKDGKTKEEILKEYDILAEYEATVHGCYKMQCHQELLIVKKRATVFLKTYYLIYKNPFTFETKIDAIINFMNEQKHEEFNNLSKKDKRYWLMNELDLPEDYFWNTYLEDPDTYIAEIDDEYIIDKELQQADNFDIK